LTAQIQKDAKEQKPEEIRKLKQQLKTHREWVRRLRNWKSCSPEAGKPWLFWVTLYLVSKHMSGARAVLV